MSSEVNIEIIKSLRGLQSSLPKDKFNELLRVYGLDEETFEKRIYGLEVEYEFLCNLYLCNMCNSIIPIEEKFTTQIGEYSCDAIIELKNGKKIMLEVKSTLDEKYSITKNNFEKRVKWANKNGYDLFFAINIKNVWMLFNEDQMKEWNRKVDISKFGKSLMTTVFNLDYLIVDDLRIVSTYSNLSVINSLEIIDGDTQYKCFKEEFYVNDELVKTITAQSNEIMFLFVSEGIRNRCDITTSVISNNQYIKTYTIKQTNFISRFDLIKNAVLKMHGASLSEKYDVIMELVKSGKISVLNDWIDYMCEVLKIQKMRVIPN